MKWRKRELPRFSVDDVERAVKTSPVKAQRIFSDPETVTGPGTSRDSMLQSIQESLNRAEHHAVRRRFNTATGHLDDAIRLLETLNRSILGEKHRP